MISERVRLFLLLIDGTDVSPAIGTSPTSSGPLEDSSPDNSMGWLRVKGLVKKYFLDSRTGDARYKMVLLCTLLKRGMV